MSDNNNSQESLINNIKNNKKKCYKCKKKISSKDKHLNKSCFQSEDKYNSINIPDENEEIKTILKGDLKKYEIRDSKLISKNKDNNKEEVKKIQINNTSFYKLNNSTIKGLSIERFWKNYNGINDYSSINIKEDESINNLLNNQLKESINENSLLNTNLSIPKTTQLIKKEEIILNEKSCFNEKLERNKKFLQNSKELLKSINDRIYINESILENNSIINKSECLIGKGTCNLKICDPCTKRGFTINKKFLHKDINPNRIFNHGYVYGSPKEKIEIIDLKNIKRNSSIGDNKTINNNSSDIINNNSSDIINNNSSDIINNNSSDNNKLIKKEEIILPPETEFIIKNKEKPISLGLLKSTNEVQKIKTENLKKLNEVSNSFIKTKSNINIQLDELNNLETTPILIGTNISEELIDSKSTDYKEMGRSLISLSSKLENIEENINKVLLLHNNNNDYINVPIQLEEERILNKALLKNQKELKSLKEKCDELDFFIKTLNNKININEIENNNKKKGVEKDLNEIINHIKFNQKEQILNPIYKNLFMNPNDEERNNKEYRSFENLVKELTLPLDGISEPLKEIQEPLKEIPERRIIFEDEPSLKTLNKKEKVIKEINGINKEVNKLNKNKGNSLKDSKISDLDELNKLISNKLKINTSNKSILNIQKPVSTKFLIVGPNELIKPVEKNNERNKIEIFEKGLKKIKKINERDIKPIKRKNKDDNDLLIKNILIPTINNNNNDNNKRKKVNIEKNKKEKSDGTFSKLSKSFSSFFTSEKKSEKSKKVVKSSPKGQKWTDHKSYLELQRNKGRVKDMIDYYEKIDNIEEKKTKEDLLDKEK